MNAIAGAVTKLSRFCGLLAVVCLLAACIVVCQLVFVRYVLEASTIWQTEFVLYSVVAATLLGSSYVLQTGGHVSVDLLGHYLSPAARRWQRLFAATLGVLFCVTLAWSGWVYFHEAWTNGWVTESVWAPPLWLVLLPLPVGLGALTLQYLVDIAALLAGGRSGTADTAGHGVDPGTEP